MRPAGIGPGPEAGLPAHKEPDPRGEALQSLHFQLGPQVHEHCHQTARRQLPNVQQGRLGDCSKKVSVGLFLKRRAAVYEPRS